MSKFWSPQLDQLVPYTPGEQPKIANLIKLNTNENPYPPAPGVFKALKEFDCDRLKLYPDPDATALKKILAESLGVGGDHIFLGNGSDEVLAHAFMAFFRQDLPLLKPNITYSFYEVYADLYGIDIENIPLEADFSIDLTKFQKPNGGIIFANPNAPTGLGLELTHIESLLQKNTDSVVLVDEAYVDFGGNSAVQLCHKYPNLLVTQTFSKSRALAGLRIGYAVGSPELIEGLERVKNSFNSYPIDMLSVVAGCEAVKDQDYFTETCERIIATRERSVKQLKRFGFTALPSQTNFLFVTHRSVPAAELMGYLRTRGVLVRHFSRPEIANYLRITIGTDEQMDALIKVLSEHPDLVELPEHLDS